MEPVAVITGANAGVGLAIAQRLLTEKGGVRICLACRNLQKANSARQQLLSEHPLAQVDVVQMDTSSVASSVKAAKEIRQRYNHVDWLFCNAGIMPVTGLNWGTLWPPTLSNYTHLFSTGGDILRIKDDVTPDGLREIFATNVFGHFLLIKELEDFLSSQGRPCHIVWTSSSSASKAEVDLDNIQAEKGKDPYAVSKKVIDLLSIELNRELSPKGVYSHTTCPGLVMSQMTYSILPKWVWSLLFPILVLIRLLITPTMTIDASNGAEAMMWLAHTDPATVDPGVKYVSTVSALGMRYVARHAIKGQQADLTQAVYKKLERIRTQCIAKGT
eukprot:Em0016g158a